MAAYQAGKSHAEVEAQDYASIAFTISSAVAGLFMVVLQLLLLKIRFSSRPDSPTTAEIYCFVAGIWLAHRILDAALSFTVDLGVYVSSGQNVSVYYEKFRRTSYNMRYWGGGPREGWPVLDATFLLLWEILATWLISNCLIFLFQTAIPLFQDVRQDHESVAARLQNRWINLGQFVHAFIYGDEVNSGDGGGGGKVGKTRSRRRRSQVANLERYHIDHHDDGQRTLTWNLIVGKPALDEMKEILGPPGGFGELGFCVSGDKICFEAMSLETKFNLNFALERNGRESLRGEKRRKSR